MIILYIIGGIFFMLLAIFFIDKREKMSVNKIQIKTKRKEAEALNQNLDDLIVQLEEMNEPLSQLNEFSKKALKFFSK